MAPRVQAHGHPGSAIQPSKSKRKEAGSTRLRRRLSNIFHRETTERGLGTRCPDSSGTSGSSHSVICQSPLNQRCLRRL